MVSKTEMINVFSEIIFTEGSSFSRRAVHVVENILGLSHGGD